MSLPVTRCSRAWLALPACLAAAPALAAGPSPGSVSPLSPSLAMRQLSRQPMSFEQNTGRFDPRVRFVARSGGATLFLTDSNATLVLPGKPKGDPETAVRDGKPVDRGPGHVLRMKLVGAQVPASVTGLEKQARIVNYFIGNDPARWRTHVPTFGRARFAGVYPGTDLVYYGNNGRMEYDFVVKPGADPGKIRLAFEGASDLRVAANGDLLARTPVGDVHLQRPYAYQAVNGQRVQVACGYSLAPGSRQVAFRTARYDASKPLVLDPSVNFSTHAGGSGSDYLCGATMQSTNATIAVGYTGSINYPVTAGALYGAKGGGSYDGAILGLNQDGTAIFCTYLGGASNDMAYRVAVDSSDAIYVCGQTASAAFATTAGAFQTTRKGTTDWFVTKLSSMGSALVYSTYLGGTSTEEGTSGAGFGGIAINSSGEAVLALPSNSADFPVTAGTVQTTKSTGYDVAIARLNAAGSGILAATFTGGTGSDQALALALGANGDVYVGGYTASTDFPCSTGAFQSTKVAPLSGFVVRLDKDLTTRIYATYFEAPTASTNSGVTAVLPASDGSCYAGGYGGAGFPVTDGAFQTAFGVTSSGMIGKVKPDGTGLAFATYVSANAGMAVNGLAFLSSGDLAFAGYGLGSGLPTSAYAIKKSPNSYDAYLGVLDPTLSTCRYLTYYGGIAGEYVNGLTLRGTTAVVFGYSSGASFTTPGAFQTTFGGGLYDGFLASFSLAKSSSALAAADASGDPGAAVTLAATLTTGATKLSGMSVAFTVDGVSVGSATTDASGVAGFSYTIPAGKAGGDYTIGASYAGETYLAASEGTGKLTVNALTAATNLAVADASGTPGSAVTLTGTLTSGGSGLSNKTISFKVAGTTVGSGTTDASGVATCSYSIPLGIGEGGKTITGTFAGDAAFTASTGSGTLTVNKIDTTLTVGDASGVPSQETTLSATLKAGGVGVAGKSVSFTVAGSSAGSGTTDANGVATVTYTVPGNTLVGNKTIAASFDGDTDYKAATGSGALSVDTIATTLAASAPDDLSAGACETVSATLTQTTGGAAISGKTLSFALGSTAIGTATTDATGKATLEFLVPDALAEGSIALNATFAGTSAYASADGSAQTAIVGGQANGYAAPATGKRGDRVKLYCYLYRNVAPRDMLAGKAIAITVDGAQVGSGTTDKNGCLTVNWTIPGSITPGVHSLAYTFAGDSHYSAWTGTKALTVTSRADLFAGSMPDGSPGATVTLYAYLYDKVSGEAYVGQTLSFLVDGVAVAAGTTDALGKATVSYTVPAGMSLGNHVITVNFAGNAGYPAASGAGKLVVLEKAVTAMYVRSYPLAVAGQKLKLYCYLYQKQGKVMLAGKTVTINVDGADVATPTTDANGYAQYLYTVPSGSATHVVTISFAGDAENKAVSGTGAVIVP